MPQKVLGRFSVSWLQVLNEKGIADKKLMPRLSAGAIRDLYKQMVVSRVFDEKCLALQRQGRMGTYASVRGQEAAQVGSAYAMEKEDWMFSAFRENAANLVRGVPPENIMAYWAGDERGEAMPPEINNFTVSIPVSTQLPHAAGAAWGMKLKRQRAASLVYFGDGATSKGDFHEAMNLAGVFKLPVVFFCQNNQYAISLPVSRQTAARTLAQKALAYGFEGLRVDGNDVFAVYLASKKALAKARSGKGPTLIEAFTYRIEHHTTADDSWRYRTKKEVEEWKKKDPIARLEIYMKKKGLLPDSYKKQVLEEARKRVEEAVRKMESMPKPRPSDMFDFVFEKPTWNLEEQKQELLDYLGGPNE
jgi:pyruvate dehydrogenase E1 component alpha subunit